MNSTATIHLVLETASGSIYALNTTASGTSITCVRGTLEDRVQEATVLSTPDYLRALHSLLTGTYFADQEDIDNASHYVHKALSERKFEIDTIEHGMIRTTEVDVARIVTNYDEVLEPLVRTAATARTWVRLPDGVRHAVTRSRCVACQQVVDLTDVSTFYLSRVRGDSRWGYEPTHKACE